MAICAVEEDLCDKMVAKTPVEARVQFHRRVVAAILMAGAILEREIRAKVGNNPMRMSPLVDVKNSPGKTLLLPLHPNSRSSIIQVYPPR